MHGSHALGAARSRECGNLIDLRALRRAGDWPGCQRHPLSFQPLGEVEQGTLSLKMPPEEQSAQLGLLCACGRRPVELKASRLLPSLLLPPLSFLALVRRLARVP